MIVQFAESKSGFFAFTPISSSQVTAVSQHSVSLLASVPTRRSKPTRVWGIVRSEIVAAEMSNIGPISVVQHLLRFKISRYFVRAMSIVEREVKHGGWVGAVAFHPQGELVATGCDDGKLRLIRSATGKVEREVEHGKWVFAVAFHPKGELVATGCMDGRLRLVRAVEDAGSPPTGTKRSLAGEARGIAEKEDLAKKPKLAEKIGSGPGAASDMEKDDANDDQPPKRHMSAYAKSL